MAVKTESTAGKSNVCLSGVNSLAETLASLELISRSSSTNSDALDPFDGLRSALFSFLSVYEHTNDLILNPTIQSIPSLPTELIAEIGSFLPRSDVQNLRLVSKRFRFAVKIIFGKDLVDNTTIYATYTSVTAFLALLLVEPYFPHKVRSLTLVGEAPRVHEYGYEWAWEQMQDREGVVSTANDVLVKNDIDYKHAEWCAVNDAFCYGGGYRTMLTLLLSRLPSLKTIKTRPLNPAEHIPDMPFTPALRNLSFYRPDLPTSSIFYGNWQYDTLHKRVTVYQDEFGDDVSEVGAGPQAGFIDDVRAAVEEIRTMGVVVEMVG